MMESHSYNLKLAWLVELVVQGPAEVSGMGRSDYRVQHILSLVVSYC